MNGLAGLEVYYESNLIPGYIDGREIGYLKQNHFTSELYIRRVLSLNHQIGTGLLFEYATVYPNKSMQELYPADFNYRRYGYAGFGLAGTYGLNTLNDLMYPFDGSRIDITIKGILKPFIDVRYLDGAEGADKSLNSFAKLYMNFENFHPLGSKLCLNSAIALGLSTDQFIPSDNFYAGGHKNNLRRNHIPFVGYNLAEVVAPDFLMIKFGLNYRLYRNFQFELLLNGMTIGTTADNLVESTFVLESSNSFLGYGTGVTYNTPLGPFSVLFAANNKEPNLTWYLNFGFTF
jgi:outer membrane translocation and assembly module TamA